MHAVLATITDLQYIEEVKKGQINVTQVCSYEGIDIQRVIVD